MPKTVNRFLRLPRIPAADPQESEQAWQNAPQLLAALNGVLGDRLVATGNPLAQPMTLRRDGQALSLDDPDALKLQLGEAASPHLLLPKTHAEYMVLVADNDDKQDPAAKEKLKAALDAAKLKSRVEVYAGAAHGWTVKGSPVYAEAAAEKAWAELLDLYKRAL